MQYQIILPFKNVNVLCLYICIVILKNITKHESKKELSTNIHLCPGIKIRPTRVCYLEWYEHDFHRIIIQEVMVVYNVVDYITWCFMLALSLNVFHWNNIKERSFQSCSQMYKNKQKIVWNGHWIYETDTYWRVRFFQNSFCETESDLISCFWFW